MLQQEVRSRIPACQLESPARILLHPGQGERGGAGHRWSPHALEAAMASLLAWAANLVGLQTAVVLDLRAVMEVLRCQEEVGC